MFTYNFGFVKCTDPPLIGRISGARAKDESIYYLVDIGLPFTTSIKKDEHLRRCKFLEQQSQDRNLFKLARFNQCKSNLLFSGFCFHFCSHQWIVAVEIPVDEVFDEWMLTEGPRFIRKIAEHFGVFQHLYGDAYFHPVTPMSISFKNSEEFSPVYFGNIIKPKNVCNSIICVFVFCRCSSLIFLLVYRHKKNRWLTSEINRIYSIRWYSATWMDI